MKTKPDPKKITYMPPVINIGMNKPELIANKALHDLLCKDNKGGVTE